MWELLTNNYSLYALFKPHWLIITLIVIYFYFKKIVNSPVYQVTATQKKYFFSAIIAFLLVSSTPIDVIGHDYLFSSFVFQLVVQYFVVIPLLMLSVPRQFFRKNIWDYRIKLIVNIAGHPWLTLFMFNGLLSIFLLPSVHNYFLEHIILMVIAQIILFINAIFMWWVIINPLPEMTRLTYILRIAYIFFASVLLIPIGFFYIVIQKIQFPVYQAVVGDILPGFTAIYDQQLAGATLKVFQLGSYIVALLFILIIWRQKEEEDNDSENTKNIRYARGVVIHLPNKNGPPKK